MSEAGKAPVDSRTVGERYSSRRTVVGSGLAARIAGRRHATSPPIASRPATAAYGVSASCGFIEVVDPLFDERGLRTSRFCVRVGIGVRDPQVVGRAMNGRARRMDGVEPLDGHIVRVAVVVALLEVG